MDPHGPYLPPEPFSRRFSHEDRWMIPGVKIPDYQILPAVHVEGEETDGNDYIDQYDNEIYYTDQQIGRLLKELEALGLVDNTIVFFSADHGESLGQHHYYFEHGREVYEDSSRIPLIVRLPGRFGVRGKKLQSLVSIMDLFPTILALLGIEDDHVEKIDGVDFSHLIFGEQGEAVDSVTPTLEVTNSRDPDEDGLTYRFEVFSDIAGDNSVAGSPQIDAGVSGRTSWTVDTALTSGQTYYWRATATDPQGGAEETELIPFVVDTTNGAPSTPAIESPPSGSVVATRAVDLVVSNADDPDGDARTYAFELDTVNTFSTRCL